MVAWLDISIFRKKIIIILQLCIGLAEMDSMGESSLYIFCLINIILCSSLSDEANKIKPLNIERALNNFSYL